MPIMIPYRRYVLNNGLRVLLHRDQTTPLVTLNLLYQVGSSDESPDRTGFAHLFEHLMFGGTPRVPDFDAAVDAMGGESNAFTNADFTNYYLTVPASGLGEALRLEADRLFRHAEGAEGRFSEEALAVQRRVVEEEYNQRYMNQPYGDAWLLLRPLCYGSHPYGWSTIGADMRHVREASMEQAEQFFDAWYRPSNAVLAIAGNMDEAEALALVRGHFEHGGNRPVFRVPLPDVYPRDGRKRRVERAVPADAVYMAWVMCRRTDPDYRVYDLVSDLLGNGHSSRLYRRLVRDERLFTEIDACITGDCGPGLFVVTGKLCPGVGFDRAEEAVAAEVRRLAAQGVETRELEKVANQFENAFLFSQYKAADRAQSLCYYEMLGHADWLNAEPGLYRSVGPDEVRRVAATLSPDCCCTLEIAERKEDKR